MKHYEISRFLANEYQTNKKLLLRNDWTNELATAKKKTEVYQVNELTELNDESSRKGHTK